MTDRPGHLRLFGGPYTLRDPSCSTLFLRKQTQRFCTWETLISFFPVSESTEAGTAVWMDYFTHSSIGIRLKNSATGSPQRIIRFSPPDGGGAEIIEQKLESLTSDVILRVVCGDRYQFGFKETMATNDQEDHHPEIIWMGEVANDVMTRPPPIGAQFTGVMLGLYAFGEHHPCYTTADFHYVNIASH